MALSRCNRFRLAIALLGTLFLEAPIYSWAQPAFTRGLVNNITDRSVSIIQVVSPVHELARIGFPLAETPSNFTMSPDGLYAYVLTSGGTAVYSVKVHKIDMMNLHEVAVLTLSGNVGGTPSSGSPSDIEISPDGSVLIVTEQGFGGLTHIVDPVGQMAKRATLNTCDYIFSGTGVNCVVNSAQAPIYFKPDSTEAYVVRNATNILSVIDLGSLTITRRYPLPSGTGSQPVFEMTGLPSLPDYVYLAIDGPTAATRRSGVLNVTDGSFVDLPIAPAPLQTFGDVELMQFGNEFYGLSGAYGNFLSYITNFVGPAQLFIRHFNSGALFTFPISPSTQKVLFNPIGLQVWSVCPVTSTGQCQLTEINIFNLASQTVTRIPTLNQNLSIAGLPGFAPDFSNYFYPIRGTSAVAVVDTATLQLSQLNLALAGTSPYGGVGMFRAQGDSSAKPQPQ